MAELKIYTVETRDSIVPASAIAALGDRSHTLQAYVFVAARTKKVAIERLSATRVNAFPNQHNVRIAYGNDLDALLRAGWLGDEGQILVKSLNGTNVVRYLGDDQYKLIGSVGRGSGLFVSAEDPYPSTLPRRSRITWERDNGQSRVALRGYVGDLPQGFEWFRIVKTSLSYEVYCLPGKVTEGPLISVIEAQEAAERILGEYLGGLGLTWKDQQ